MGTIREAINMILWRGICSECRVVLEDRLAGMGFVEISACSIRRVDASYIYLKNGKVLPIHRVRKIECRGKTIIDR